MAGASTRLQNRTARNSEAAPVLERPTGRQIRPASLPRRGAIGRRASNGCAEHTRSRMGGATEDASIALVAKREIERNSRHAVETGLAPSLSTQRREAIIGSNATIFPHAAPGSGANDGGADFSPRGHAASHPRT